MASHIKWTQDPSVQKFLIIGNVLSLIPWLLSFVWIEDGARILSIPAYAFVCVTLIWLFDKYLLKEVDLIEEFKEGNPNAGLWLLAAAIVMAAVVSVLS